MTVVLKTHTLRNIKTLHRAHQGSHVRRGGREGRARCSNLGKAIRRQNRIFCRLVGTFTLEHLQDLVAFFLTKLCTGYPGVRGTRGRRIGISFGIRATEGVFQQRMPRPELASGHPRPAVLGPVRGCAGTVTSPCW